MESTLTTSTDSTPSSTGQSDATAFLAAIQLADSAFPAGLYAFSHGLETAVQERHVRTPDDLERFLSDWLAWQVGPGDADLVAAAHRATAASDLATLIEIDQTCAATKLAREAREASQKTGARLLATAVLLAPEHVTLAAYHHAVRSGATPGGVGGVPGTYVAAFGAATAALDVPVQTAVLAELHGACTTLLGAALRLMRIDHQHTQAILRRQAPRLAHVAQSALAADWRGLRPTAPFAEILQMRHEAAHVRLFSS